MDALTPFAPEHGALIAGLLLLAATIALGAVMFGEQALSDAILYTLGAVMVGLAALATVTAFDHVDDRDRDQVAFERAQVVIVSLSEASEQTRQQTASYPSTLAVLWQHAPELRERISDVQVPVFVGRRSWLQLEVAVSGARYGIVIDNGTIIERSCAAVAEACVEGHWQPQ